MVPREEFSRLTGLLAGAISYALGVCTLVAPAEMALPTPCAEWDLYTLIAHLGDSVADLETAIRAGHLDLDRPPSPAKGDLAKGDLAKGVSAKGVPAKGHPVKGDPLKGGMLKGALVRGDPVEVLRDRAAELLCASYGYPGPERFVAVGGLPIPVGVVACTGAVEIAVHGWDIAQARGDGRPIPPTLATPMLGICPLLVAGREGLFAVPVRVPAQASPGARLVGYLGRDPGRPALVTGK